MEDSPHSETIVIGAGVIGTACAFRLTQAGRRVRLIDANAPGTGCSFGNAGVIAIDHLVPLSNADTLRSLPAMLLDRDGPLRVHPLALPRLLPWSLAFARASRQLSVEAGTAALSSLVTRALPAWQRLCADAQSANVLRDTGVVYVYENPITPARQQAAERLLTEHGVRFTNLTPRQVKHDYLPALVAPIQGGRYFPEMATVADPHAVVTTLLDAAVNSGARFTRAPVTGFKRDAGRVTHVTTEQGAFACDAVLISAGVETAELAQRLGLRVPLIRERGYHVNIAPGSATLPVAATFVERGFVCNPMTMGLRLAGTVEIGGRREPDWRRAELLVRHCNQLFRFEHEVSAVSRWYGDRPTLPDYLPMIDRIASLHNGFIATGHQHLGLTLAAVTAEIVERLVAGSGQPDGPDLIPFRSDRFTSNALR